MYTNEGWKRDAGSIYSVSMKGGCWVYIRHGEKLRAQISNRSTPLPDDKDACAR